MTPFPMPLTTPPETTIYFVILTVVNVVQRAGRKDYGRHIFRKEISSVTDAYHVNHHAFCHARTAALGPLAADWRFLPCDDWFAPVRGREGDVYAQIAQTPPEDSEYEEQMCEFKRADSDVSAIQY